MHPKFTSKLSQKATQEVSGGLEMSIPSGLGFKLRFNRFWDDFGTPNRTPKSIKNLSWGPRGDPGTPKAAQRPPGSHFGAVWDPFWSDFGSHVGEIWEQFSNIFQTPPPCHYCYHSVPVSQFLRVGGCPR